MHRVALNLIYCEEIMVLNTVCELYYQNVIHVACGVEKVFICWPCWNCNLMTSVIADLSGYDRNLSISRLWK